HKYAIRTSVSHAHTTHISPSNMIRPPPTSTLFPYTTLFRSDRRHRGDSAARRANRRRRAGAGPHRQVRPRPGARGRVPRGIRGRSEEHTSELQSRFDLVCRLLLEKKKNNTKHTTLHTTQHKQ